MKPVLYSYRRCPYAMRARMALKYAGIDVEHREIELRNKPQSMLLVSPKGTVPVLCLDDAVLDQSLDIMLWAIEQSDPDGWIDVDDAIAQAWIEKNDGRFKVLLDQYKYPNRFPELDPQAVLDGALEWMLLPMERSLQNSQYLLGNKMSWVDIALFPFIRQFSMVDANQFEQLSLPATKRWLTQHLESELFNAVMQKHPVWQD
ncbi:glutathione S-transferase [Polynucleobacter sp. UK-Gri1-W3]|uniref:glutathione S-transferase n=1 Tax=Polynucleobacter sp. UK-Gri1-W3 TaxID=1819737 RepID=UPI001C0B1260|nr:glutathione S-transferase [Polynucleobacter sp. UK-Gri1-W3]MBU3538626.1 glutathione S-transferase [Polynucleobacter sp. UK-Gri1-W3]